MYPQNNMQSQHVKHPDEWRIYKLQLTINNNNNKVTTRSTLDLSSMECGVCALVESSWGPPARSYSYQSEHACALLYSLLLFFFLSFCSGIYSQKIYVSLVSPIYMSCLTNKFICFIHNIHMHWSEYKTIWCTSSY